MNVDTKPPPDIGSPAFDAPAQAPLHLGHGSFRSIAAHAQALRHIRGRRQSWRHRRLHRGAGRTVRSRYPFSVAPRAPAGGAQLLLLGSSVRYDNVTLSIDLTNPDILLDGHIVLSRDSLQRKSRGRMHAELRGDGEVALVYLGLDGVVWRTELRFIPPPTRRSTSTATYALILTAGFFRRQATWICAACRNCFAASGGDGAPDRRLIRSPARRKLGRAARCS